MSGEVSQTLRAVEGGRSQTGHPCLFCFKESKDPQDLISRHRIQIKPKSFQALIHYLTGTDPTFDKISKSECDKNGVPFVGSYLPPMCQSCYSVLGQLSQLHAELLSVQRKIQKKTEAARRKMVTAYQEKPADKKLLSGGSLHLKVIEAGSTQRLLFPARCPPSTTSKPIPPFTTELVFVEKEPELSPSTPVVKTEPEVPTTAISEDNQDDGHSAEDLFSDNSFLMETEIPDQPERIVEQEQEPEVAGEGEDDIEFEPEWMGGANRGRDDTSSDEDYDPKGSSTRVLRSSGRKRKTRDPEKRGDEEKSGFLCDFEGCGKSLSSRQEVKRHQARIHKVEFPKIKKKYSCHACDKSWDFKKNFRAHLLKRHPTHPELKLLESRRMRQTCDMCAEKAIPINEIEAHLKLHFGGEPEAGQGFITKCVNPKCKKMFSCYAKMEQHASQRRCWQVRKGEWFSILTKKCEHCAASGLKFETNSQQILKRHMDRHELELRGSEKPFRCPIPNCTEVFSLERSLDLHIATHDFQPPPSEQPCKLCEESDIILPVGPETLKHLKEKHEVSEPVTCKRCPYLFKDEDAAMWHQLESHRKGTIPCNLCENEITTKKFFLQHYFREHGIGTEIEQTFICDQCSREFHTMGALKVHAKASHPEVKVEPSSSSNKTPRFTCNLCPDQPTFSYKSQILTHKIQLHGAPPLECNLCSETFLSGYKLSAHMREHRGLKLYSCQAAGCGRTYKTNSELQKHTDGAHRPGAARKREKSHVCNQCGKSYYDKQYLKTHIENVHLGIRHFCEHCGESFATPLILKKHQLIHTGERPHKCPVCGQAFRTREVMKRHIQSHEEKGDSFRPTGQFKNIRKRAA